MDQFNIRKKRQTFSFYISNFLIITSLFGLGYIYFPLLRIYTITPEIKQTLPEKGLFITIPKIGAQSKVIENVDPWNESEYKKALTLGVAQAKGTHLPGENGLIFLFAHSSDNPFQITRYNTIFFKLNQLNNNDSIIITRNGKNYIYKVYDKKIVWPSEIQYLTDKQGDELILQTCTPPGTSLKRLLIFAKP